MGKSIRNLTKNTYLKFLFDISILLMLTAFGENDETTTDISSSGDSNTPTDLANPVESNTPVSPPHSSSTITANYIKGSVTGAIALIKNAKGGTVNLDIVNSQIEQVADQYGLDNINLTTVVPTVLEDITSLMSK